MNSRTLPAFWKLYYQLPRDVRRRAAKTYRIWRIFPHSPGLQFKLIGSRRPVYSVRITDAYRALGLLEEDTIYWFWIGAHDEYERIIKSV
jgi:hypothetical protein